MGATPLYLEIILAQANAYSRASVALRLSGTVSGPDDLILVSCSTVKCTLVEVHLM